MLKLIGGLGMSPSDKEKYYKSYSEKKSEASESWGEFKEALHKDLEKNVRAGFSKKSDMLTGFYISIIFPLVAALLILLIFFAAIKLGIDTLGWFILIIFITYLILTSFITSVYMFLKSLFTLFRK